MKNVTLLMVPLLAVLSCDSQQKAQGDMETSTTTVCDDSAINSKLAEYGSSLDSQDVVSLVSSLKQLSPDCNNVTELIAKYVVSSHPANIVVCNKGARVDNDEAQRTIKDGIESFINNNTVATILDISGVNQSINMQLINPCSAVISVPRPTVEKKGARL